ncbi:hypothetical protein AB4Z55_20150 [Gordonia sp. ABKF26]|uniref:hypothetical protein n=1 Tax=Gordonia sp. ABKF26 TaxID=3238687 RepID=UPI0034E49187
MATAFVERCKTTYYAVRDAQMQRADEFAIGYDTDRAAYFDKIEPRVLYRDVMVSVAAELRAERAAERAEVEFWQDAERAHYAAWVDDALAEEVTEDITRLFRTRFLALVWSAVCRAASCGRCAGYTPAVRRGLAPSNGLADAPGPGARRGPDVATGRDRSGGRGPPGQVSPVDLPTPTSRPTSRRSPPCSPSSCLPPSS